MEQYHTLLSLSLQKIKTGDHCNTVHSGGVPWSPVQEAKSQQEQFKFKYVVYDWEYSATQNTHVKARNSQLRA